MARYSEVSYHRQDRKIVFTQVSCAYLATSFLCSFFSHPVWHLSITLPCVPVLPLRIFAMKSMLKNVRYSNGHNVANATLPLSHPTGSHLSHQSRRKPDPAEHSTWYAVIVQSAPIHEHRLQSLRRCIFSAIQIHSAAGHFSAKYNKALTAIAFPSYPNSSPSIVEIYGNPSSLIRRPS